MHAAVHSAIQQTNRFKGGLRLRLMKTVHRLGYSFQRRAAQRGSSAGRASARPSPARSWLEQFKLAKALSVGDVSDRQPQVDAADLWRVRLLELFHPVRNLLAVAGADAFSSSLTAAGRWSGASRAAWMACSTRLGAARNRASASAGLASVSTAMPSIPRRVVC